MDGGVVARPAIGVAVGLLRLEEAAHVAIIGDPNADLAAQIPVEMRPGPVLRPGPIGRFDLVESHLRACEIAAGAFCCSQVKCGVPVVGVGSERLLIQAGRHVDMPLSAANIGETHPQIGGVEVGKRRLKLACLAAGIGGKMR